jgi:uncharacterized protein (DUF433 family)
MHSVDVGKYLVADPEVCHAQLTFKGTRVPVETVLIYLAKGRSLKEVLGDWPQLKQEAVVEAIQLAAAALTERYTECGETGDEPVCSGRPA